jgi:hypothetical protein
MAAKKKAAAKTKAEAPKGRVIPKEIKVRLTKDQCLQRANQASQLSKELTEKEEEFKEAEAAWKQEKAQFKNAVKNLQDQVRKLLVEVKAQEMESTEDVLFVINHDAGVAEYWFPPSGPGMQIVETRPLEDGERQLSLVEDAAAAMPEEGQEVSE